MKQFLMSIMRRRKIRETNHQDLQAVERRLAILQRKASLLGLMPSLEHGHMELADVADRRRAACDDDRPVAHIERRRSH